QRHRELFARRPAGCNVGPDTPSAAGLQKAAKPLISGAPLRFFAMTGPDSAFGRRISIEQVEEGHTLAPRFDEHGLIPVVTTDAESGELLMHGYMNAEALARTIETAEAHYYSRSRQALWHKGATSGLVQQVVEMRIDDDQDAV